MVGVGWGGRRERGEKRVEKKREVDFDGDDGSKQTIWLGCVPAAYTLLRALSLTP